MGEIIKAFLDVLKESKSRSESSVFGTFVFALFAFNYKEILSVLLMFNLNSRTALLFSLTNSLNSWLFWAEFLVLFGVWVYLIPFLNLKISVSRYNLFEKNLKKQHFEDRMEEARHRRAFLDIENGNKTLEELQKIVNAKTLELDEKTKEIDELKSSNVSMVTSEVHTAKVQEVQLVLSDFQNQCNFLVEMIRSIDYKGYYREALNQLKSGAKLNDLQVPKQNLLITDLSKDELEDCINSRDIDNLLENSILLQYAARADVVDSIKEPMYSTISSVYKLDRNATQLLVDELPRLKYQDRIRHIERVVGPKL